MTSEKFGLGQPNVELNVSGEPTDWGAFAYDTTDRLLAEYPGKLAGVLYKTVALKGGTAFQGPFLPTGGEAGYATEGLAVCAEVHSGSRANIYPEVNSVHIPVDRLAEIADGYSLPAHLINPGNPIDAAIAYVISKMASIDPDTSKSLKDIADGSRAIEVAKNPELTLAQQTAAFDYGEVAFEQGNENTLYKAERLEALEHVLRFLLYREYSRSKAYGRPFTAHMGTDYHAAKGILAEALSAVNGVNSFAEVGVDAGAGLAMGSLPSKLNIAISDDAVMVSAPKPGGMKPIWPPSRVAEYEHEEAKQIEMARLAEEAAAMAERQRDAERRAARAAEAEQEAAKIANLEALIGPLEELGYTWRGILLKTGRLATEEGLAQFIADGYPGVDVHVVDGFAIYGGTKITIDPNAVTLFIKEPGSGQPPTLDK